MCESDFDVFPQLSSDSGSNDSLKRSSVAAKVLLSPWNQTQGAFRGLSRSSVKLGRWIVFLSS